MDLKSGALLVPPTVKNSSCSHPRYNSHNFIIHIGIAETIEALLILVLTLGVIGANALVIFVINNRRYSPYIHQQPRYLLTSLALNDLTIGLLITPFGLLPALFHCWPYGEIFCQIQALLRGALSQQSAVILVCMAVDRYMCALHPRKYYQHSSKKGCVAILSLTWIVSLTVFGFLVLPKGYYFNNTGLMACEPFYTKPSYRILSTCALYFPTTMVLMYCYGSSFHMSRFRLNDPITGGGGGGTHHPHHPLSSSAALQNTPVMNLSMAMSMGLNVAGMSGPSNTITKKIVPIQEKQSNGSTSRSMAAISLGFIVMVTPWTIQEIVTACTGSKLPPFLDFLVTWTALSNSLWNPFIYWVLNSNFRRLSRHLLPNRCFPTEDTFPEDHKSPCCGLNSDCDITTLPMPPEPPTGRPPSQHTSISGGSVLGICGRVRANSLSRSVSQHMRGPSTISGHLHGHGHSHQHQHGGYSTMRPDIEGLSEKYWGEILERTVSSGSLHALQKTIPHHHYLHHQHHYAHPTSSSGGGGGGGCGGTTTTMTTSFSKNSDLNSTISEHAASEHDGSSSFVGGGGGGRFATINNELNKFSSSEPKLCEHFINYHHDANCAKNKCALSCVSSGGGGGGAATAVETHAVGDSKIGRNIPDI